MNELEKLLNKLSRLINAEIKVKEERKIKEKTIIFLEFLSSVGMK